MLMVRTGSGLLLGWFAVCGTIGKSSEPKGSTTLRIKRQRLIVGRDTVAVEVAETEEMRRVGLMFRETLAENEGMLFVFDSAGIYPFWMKNTVIPLSIAFIDDQGVIRGLQDMMPNDELTYHAPPVPVRYALEMNQGWFAERQVRIGDQVQFLPRTP